MARDYLARDIWFDGGVKNYVVLDVTGKIEPPSVCTVDGVDLLPKDEFHCSLVALGKLTDDEALIAQAVSDIRTYLSESPDRVTFQTLTDRHFVCQKDDQMTMIVEAIVLGLDGLREVVRRTIPDYEPTFPHVTLLKNADSEYGIGVNSAEDLTSLCREYKSE